MKRYSLFTKLNEFYYFKININNTQIEIKRKVNNDNFLISQYNMFYINFNNFNTNHIQYQKISVMSSSNLYLRIE